MSTPQDGPQQISDTGQRVFECLSIGLVVFDERLQIVHHNAAAAFLLSDHTSIADALAASTVDARYHDWRQILRDVIDSGREKRFDQVVHRDPQQGERLLNILCIPLTDQGGRHVSGGTLAIEDVTAAVTMEQRLAVSERMAAVGKLAARVAHELNNPLDGILRYLNLALRTVEQNNTEKLTEYLQRARGGIERMTAIVRELVDFSRSTQTGFDETGINDLIEEAIKVMADKAVAGDTSIVCRLAKDIPAVAGTSLFQVFCNLIKNALDAMPDGGTLTIISEFTDGHVLIQFEDTGIGLPEQIGRIFEPFFTTKAPGKGTGLGLAISKDIIEKYNGRITADRRAQGGSVFTIRLPLTDGSAIRPAGTSPRDPAIRPRFTSAPRESKA